METKNQVNGVMPVVRNKFGVCVKQCCCSCAFKEETRLMSERYCTKHEKSVKMPSVSVCQHWKMNMQQRMAGLGHGKVKCREYLMYVLKVRESEDPEATPKSVQDIRQEFEEKYGSIFM